MDLRLGFWGRGAVGARALHPHARTPGVDRHATPRKITLSLTIIRGRPRRLNGFEGEHPFGLGNTHSTPCIRLNNAESQSEQKWYPRQFGVESARTPVLEAGRGDSLLSCGIYPHILITKNQIPS